MALTSYRLVAAERIRESGRWSGGLRRLASDLLAVAVRGRIRCVADGEMAVLEPGGLLIGRQGGAWEAEGQSDDGIRLYLFAFRSGESEENGERQGPPLRAALEKVPASAMPAIADLCEALVRQWEEPDPVERFRSQALFHELPYRLLRRAARRRPAAPRPRWSGRRRTCGGITARTSRWRSSQASRV